MSLDYNIFVAEFRKVSLEMIGLLDTMINLLKSLHDEWTVICTNGKDKEFSKEYLREKLRERVSNDRAKRLSVLIENQKEMKVQMENQHEHENINTIETSDEWTTWTDELAQSMWNERLGNQSL